MEVLYVFYRGDLVESICETVESALKEEEYQVTRPTPAFMASIYASDINRCWNALNEFEDLGLEMRSGHFEITQWKLERFSLGEYNA